LSRIHRQHEAAARDATLDLDDQPPGPGIIGIGVGGDRLRQRDIDFADMVAGDRLGLDACQFTGVDGLLDRDDAGAALARAEPNQDLLAFAKRLVGSQKMRAWIRLVSRGANPV
jgi:hypothetical protein